LPTLPIKDGQSVIFVFIFSVIKREFGLASYNLIEISETHWFSGLQHQVALQVVGYQHFREAWLLFIFKVDGVPAYQTAWFYNPGDRGVNCHQSERLQAEAYLYKMAPVARIQIEPPLKYSKIMFISLLDLVSWT
jgi:hypothetical protein